MGDPAGPPQLNSNPPLATNGQLGSPAGTLMTRFAKLACPVAVIAALSLGSAPASAQFAGIDGGQMEQFAPMLEMMKQKMGKRRFGRMMQTIGPMMMQMQGQGGFPAMLGGGGMPMIGSGIDMGRIVGMIGPMEGLMGGSRGKARRHRG
jgi:hypothetical protein